MNDLEQYYEIVDHIYSLTTILLTAYCYASLAKPFLLDTSSSRLQKSRTWLVAAAYACIMLFLHYMPYYINAILAYSIGILGTFFVMCLLNPVYIRQKLFLSITFFSLRWQAWRIVGQTVFAWHPLIYKFISNNDKIVWFRVYVIECVRDSLFGFFLMYVGVRFLLRVYGKKQEHMKLREFLILTIPSLSGICAYVMIFFYYKVYTSALEQASLSVKIGYEMLIGIYAVICYATNLAIIWLFRQWKTEQEEDRQREIFSRQMQDLESHITEAERLYKDMRALRHDVGNHLMTLKQLYTRGEYEEAEKYADSLTCEMQKASIGARSGNPVTDVILSERRKEMEEKGIDFTSDFHYPADSGINAFDISIVLNNGLSNAIEAIERNNLPAPHISLYSYHMKNMYIIEITNSFTGELEADEWNGLPLTTKTGDGHGFGLSSIRQVANKYLGDMEIGKERYKQEERCVLRVMLQIAPELQTEIPAQGGKWDTNRIKHHRESDDTRAGGAEMFFLFLCVSREAGGERREKMAKFLSYEDRLEIQNGLKEHLTFTEIGKRLGRDRTTITKEVRNYSVEQDTGYSVFPHNTCKYRKGCRRKKVCGTGECKHPLVPTCRQCELLCNRYCEQYEEEVCTHRFKPPYVCNGCREVKKCTLTKTVYDALEAQRKATAKISESRSGILSTEGEIARLNEILVPLVKQGQSIHQIYLNNKDELMCSEKTLYNYIDGCLFDIRNIDLPRKVKYRPRYKEPELKIDRGCRVGRNYHDYEVYMEKHPDTAVVQMDSVIGSRGGKALLTVYFVNVSLMLGFLREANTSKSVIDIYDELYQRLGGQDFRRLFPVILTDNGSEFSNPKCIEKGPDGKGFQRTRIYYCNPSAPYQKAEIEVGHEFIRRVVPKGKSFDELAQADIDLMMNHINSYRRNKLNGKSPYEAFCFYYGEELAQKLGCHEVDAANINLTPRLLKK